MGFAAAAAIVITIIGIWGWRALNWVWLRPKKLEKQLRRQGFVGNSYRFLWGDMKENTSMLMEAYSNPIPLSHDIAPRITPFLSNLLHTYGKKTFMWVGPKPRVVIMDPEMIKEVLNKNFKFEKLVENPLFRLFVLGLPLLEGDKWAKHRRILNPAFHSEKLKSMLPALELCCCEMIKKWQQVVVEGGINNSCELDVWPSLETLTSDVISTTAFGSSFEEGRRVFELQIEQAQLALTTVQSVYVPGMRFLPTKRNQRMKEIDREVRHVLRGIIDKKTKAMKSGEGSSDDLLGILLDSNSKEVEGNKNVGMSIEDVMDECKIFYFAGQETTSILLAWTMVLLSINQNWQDRAREEVLQVIGNDKADVDHLSRLKIVTMILNEVLRLYPPVSGLVRKIDEETTLKDITLQPGTQIVLPVTSIHHDHNIWGADADEFNPERFSEGVSKATKNQAVAFLPFGGGARICIGQNFAMLEAKLAMAMILKNFSFQLSASYTHAPISIFTLKPLYGASLILHKL